MVRRLNQQGTPIIRWEEIVVMAVALPYHDCFRFYTLDPIVRIDKAQYDQKKLWEALEDFRRLQVKESDFVRTASTLSAAAVIGVFSWPSTEYTPWPAKVLWHWALVSSCFSLISTSRQQGLVNSHFGPDGENDENDNKQRWQQPWPLVHIRAHLSLVLGRSKSRRSDDGESGSGPRDYYDYVLSWTLVWMWQSPTMLMSWSWVMFLLGYALHILSPVFDRGSAGDGAAGWETWPVPVAGVTLGLCFLTVSNVFACCHITRCQMKKVEEQRARVIGKLSWY